MRALFVALSVLAACGGPLEVDDESALGLRRGVDVRATDSVVRPRWRVRYEIDTTNTLYFAADVRGVHALAFEVFEPSGGVWQRTEVQSDGEARAFVSMPVAGTWIQQYALSGVWSVRVFVDEAPDPAGQLSFTLR